MKYHIQLNKLFPFAHSSARGKKLSFSKGQNCNFQRPSTSKQRGWRKLQQKGWRDPHLELKLSGCMARVLIQAGKHHFPFWVRYFSICQLSVTMQVHACLTCALFFFSTKILTSNTEQWSAFHVSLKKAELWWFLMRTKQLWPIVLVNDRPHRRWIL